MGRVLVRRRRFIDARGTESAQTFVHCTHRDRLRSTQSCLNCGFGSEIRSDPIAGAVVACTKVADVAAGDLVRAARTNQPVPESRDPLVAACPLEVVVAARRAPMEALRKAFAGSALDALAVLDGHGVPVGLLTRSDVVTRGDGATTAAEVMTPDPVVLPASESARAAALEMTRGGATHAIVLGWGGAVVGVVSAEALLRLATSEPAEQDMGSVDSVA